VRTYFLSSHQCQEQIKTISFFPAPATMRELTACQGNNARSRSRPSASFQLQPPSENLLPVMPRMPGADQHHQLHSSYSHFERTYILSSQECQEHIKTISFIPAPATRRELTHCHMNDPTSISNVHNVPDFASVKRSCHTAPPLSQHCMTHYLYSDVLLQLFIDC
jgi:hypothetical protein